MTELVKLDEERAALWVKHIRAHKRSVLIIGLLSLLRLQHEVEGHLDEPVVDLAFAELHKLEEDLRALNVRPNAEDIPF